VSIGLCLHLYKGGGMHQTSIKINRFILVFIFK